MANCKLFFEFVSTEQWTREKERKKIKCIQSETTRRKYIYECVPERLPPADTIRTQDRTNASHKSNKTILCIRSISWANFFFSFLLLLLANSNSCQCIAIQHWTKLTCEERAFSEKVASSLILAILHTCICNIWPKQKKNAERKIKTTLLIVHFAQMWNKNEKKKKIPIKFTKLSRGLFVWCNCVSMCDLLYSASISAYILISHSHRSDLWLTHSTQIDGKVAGSIRPN